MVGPCVIQIEFLHVLEGGFVEVSLALISTETGVQVGRKTEKVFPNTTLQVGPFQALLRFADAELSCPLELYLKDFVSSPVQDFRPEDNDTVFGYDDSLDGNQHMP